MEKNSYLKTSHENLKDAFISNRNWKKIVPFVTHGRAHMHATTHINLVDQMMNDNNNYINMGTTQ
jgi:cobalamin biosynthesis Co2+ chelatase CbiK